MDYKYNEEEYAKTIFDNGFQTRFIRYELLVLVKYLKKDGYTKKQTEDFLYKFCEKNLEGFNKVMYFKVIDNAIRDGRKNNNKLIVVDSVNIMTSEIEYINSLNIDDDCKKLLLSFLVSKKISMEIYKINNESAKLSTYFSGSKKKFNEIFKKANINGKNKIDDMMSKLVEKGIVLSINRGDIVLEFVNLISSQDDNIFYQLKPQDFDNVGYVFDYYNGDKKISKCSECGRLIKLPSFNSNKKYCDECARELQKKWQRESMRKLRNKKNVK